MSQNKIPLLYRRQLEQIAATFEELVLDDADLLQRLTHWAANQELEAKGEEETVAYRSLYEALNNIRTYRGQQ
jgi:hypothetical protein